MELIFRTHGTSPPWRKRKAASGLEIAWYHLHDSLAQPLISPKPEVRERTVRPCRWPSQGGQRGCKSVLSFRHRGEDVTYEQCWERSIEGIKRCLPAAGKKQVRHRGRNFWNRFINEPVAAKRFVEEINHPLVGWHFDIGKCVPSDGPSIGGARWKKTHHQSSHQGVQPQKRDKEGPYAGFAVDSCEGDTMAVRHEALDEIGYEGIGILRSAAAREAPPVPRERTDKIFAL